MAILRIRTYPDEVLKKKAAPVKCFDEVLQRLIDDMLETMYAAPGIGLAAPQVGVSERLIVIDISSKEEPHPPVILINPEIVDSEGQVESEEGCLSLPDFHTTVKRADTIVVSGLDRNGNPAGMQASGLLARALQHEVDHLDGLLLLDRVGPIKREFFKKRFKKKASPEN